MRDITLLLQVVALACFFIGWMGWPIPASRALNWTTGGFFWLLLSFMFGGLAVSLHQVG